MNIQEFEKKIKTRASLKKRYDGIILKDLGETVEIVKLPDHTEKNRKLPHFKEIVKELKQSLKKEFCKEVVYREGKVENSEPVNIREIEETSEKTTGNAYGCIKFLSGNKQRNTLPIHSSFMFRVDDSLYSEILKTGALNKKLFADMKNDLDYAKGYIFKFKVNSRGLIVDHFRVKKIDKKFVNVAEIKTKQKFQEAFLSDTTIQSLVLHINKKYSKAFRTSSLPIFKHFNDSFLFGVSGVNVEPIHFKQEVIDFYKSIRCKLIKGQPAAEYISKVLYQELKSLDVLIYDYSNYRMSAYDSNKTLVEKAITDYFNKIGDDLTIYISKPEYILKLMSLYSKLLCEYYIRGVEQDLDRIIEANKKEGKQ